MYASGTDLESANPLVTIHPLARQVQRHVLLVTLVRYDSTLDIEPYYARGWRWGNGNRRLTFTLEPALHWHDGPPTTARDVAFTLNAARDPASGFPRASDLAAVREVTALDDSTVVITFATSQRGIPAVLAELPIVPAHVLGGVPLRDMRRAQFNLDPVGNGPFRFVDRVPGQRWTFARNPGFPASMGGPPGIRQLVVAVVDEATTKFAGLSAGDLDFAGIAPTMATLAERDPMIEVMDYPVLFASALVFNTQRPPFDDVRVRRAVSLSVDRERIIAVALAGFATPAAGPVPPANPLSLDTIPAHDVALADSLLDAAGWRRGAEGWRSRQHPLEIELLTVGSSDNELEQLIQADLAGRGIRVRIRQMEMAAFLSRARATEKDFDLLVTGVPGDLSLAYVRAMFESTHHGGTLDYAGYHSPALDRLFGQAAAAGSDRELRLHWLAIQRELAVAIPAAWLYHSRGLQGVSARMRNVEMDLRGEMASVTRWSTAPDSANVLAKR